MKTPFQSHQIKRIIFYGCCQTLDFVIIRRVSPMIICASFSVPCHYSFWKGSFSSGICIQSQIDTGWAIFSLFN
uniref:Uncharacterized protein n=1 Tax=Octopus bimaculoides TaxID=37653 RepID=A0A0L8HFQ8_OCTBM